MSPFEFENERIYKDIDLYGDEVKITAKRKVASLVNSDWIYSNEWPDDAVLMIAQAKIDVDKETKCTLRRLDRLQEAKRLLDGVIL